MGSTKYGFFQSDLKKQHTYSSTNWVYPHICSPTRSLQKGYREISWSIMLFFVEETVATYSITTERSKLRVVHLTLSWCFGDAILVCLLLGNRFRTSCFWLSGEFEYSSCSHSDKGISPMADSNFLPPRGPAPPMCWLAIGSPGHLMATMGSSMSVVTNGTAPTKAACAGSNVSSHSLKHWTSHQEELHSSSSPMSEPHKQWCCIASWQLGQFTRPPNATQYNSYTYYQTRKASPQITKPRKLLQIHIKPEKTTPNTYQTRKTAPIRK